MVAQEVLQRRQAPWRWGVQHPAIRSWQRPTESAIEADPLTTTREVAEELNVDHSTVIWHLKQAGKMKRLDKWVASGDDHKSRKSSFWNVFSYSTQQRTISWLDCDMWQKADFMWQLVTISVDGLIRSSKALPKAKRPPKKCHDHCLVVCCPSDPLQFSESWQNHCFGIEEVWEICSASEQYAQQTDEMPAAGTGQQKGPCFSPWHHQTIHRTINASKVERIRLGSFASSAIFTWPLSNWLSLQTYRQPFAEKMFLQLAGGRKCFPRVCWIPKHGFIHYRNKQTSFLGGKNVLIVVVPILIHKDVFEPSYDYLKFTVPNLNYFCTNLRK